MHCFRVFFATAQKKSNLATQLLLLGTFHFSNPGLDAVKFKSADINSDSRQREIRQVIDNIKQFHPDKIFIEAGIDEHAVIDSQYNAYLKGTYVLSTNETNQIGFRLAKELSQKSIRETQFPFDSLLTVAKRNNQVELINAINNK